MGHVDRQWIGLHTTRCLPVIPCVPLNGRQVSVGVVKDSPDEEGLPSHAWDSPVKTRSVALVTLAVGSSRFPVPQVARPAATERR